jgi:2-hydroxy-3-oxopropionate reductase
MTERTIGFIGLGIMGKPMVANLQEAGHDLVVHDLDPDRLSDAILAGAVEAASAREVAERSDVIITMLPDSPDVESVVFGDDGLIEGVSGGQLYIDMSTIAPQVAVRVADALAQRGVRCLDAPVSGGDVGAIEGKLSIMAGGEKSTFEDALPVLRAMGETITLCGPIGSGQIVKACNQIQVALNLVGMAEALTLGAKAGVDPEVIIQVLSGGYAQTRVMDVRGPRVIRGDFEPGFKAKLHYKDINIVMQSGRDYGVPLPASAIARELFGAVLAAGRGELDHSAVLTALEDLARVEARTG